MSCIWKKVLKTYGNPFKGFNTDHAVDEVASNKILVFGKQLELDINEEGVPGIASVKTEEISGQELIELQGERSKKVGVEEELVPKPLQKFTAEKLAEAFAAISRGMRMLEEMDGNYERFSRADRQIQDALVCYREIYNEKRKQAACSELHHTVRSTVPAGSSAHVGAPHAFHQLFGVSAEGRQIDRGTVASTSRSSKF